MPSDPQEETIKTYQENFSKYIERTPSSIGTEYKDWMNSFASCLVPEASILEIGSATGRDARYFRSKGFRVICTDVVPEAVAMLSKEGFEAYAYDFRDDPKPEWFKRFDGVFANAVLLHANEAQFSQALKNIAVMLKPAGVFAFSVKTGIGEAMTSEKMNAPRYFKYYSKKTLTAVLSDLLYEIVDIRTAEDGKWLQVIVRIK